MIFNYSFCHSLLYLELYLNNYAEFKDAFGFHALASLNLDKVKHLLKVAKKF